MINVRISKAWLRAAIDLDIRVIAPVTLTIADGSKAEFEAHILDYGAPGGAIVMSETSRRHPDTLDSGRWYSTLFESYEVYDKQLFAETLDDWRWYGAGKPPSWYTGKSWTAIGAERS